MKGTKTEQNLLKAFAGESQARNRYDYFAKQAKKKVMSKLQQYLRKQPLMSNNMQKSSSDFLKVEMLK